MIKKSKIKNQKLKIHPKIKNFGFWFVILIFGFLILNFNCYAQSVSSTELINNAKEYDGKTVVYAGEVIGDIMVRGRNAWVNINDGLNAIGIWIDKNLVKDITYTASYKFQGDIVEVKGVFHRACPQHGADLDIHAQDLKKIKEGSIVAEEENILKRNLAIILIGGLCLALMLRRLKVK